MKIYGLEGGGYSFLTAAVDGGQRSASLSSLLTPGNETRYHCVGCWVGTRAGLVVSEKRKIFFLYRDWNPGPFNP